MSYIIIFSDGSIGIFRDQVDFEQRLEPPDAFDGEYRVFDENGLEFTLRIESSPYWPETARIDRSKNESDSEYVRESIIERIGLDPGTSLADAISRFVEINGFEFC